MINTCVRFLYMDKFIVFASSNYGFQLTAFDISNETYLETDQQSCLLLSYYA